MADITARLMLIVVLATTVATTSLYSFNFAANVTSGNSIFSSGSMNIKISSPSSYVEVKGITQGRSASGMIQMDYSNQVIFEGVLNIATSYDYYIGIQMHSYYQASYYYLFCLPIVTIYGVSGVWDTSSNSNACTQLELYDVSSIVWNGIDGTLGRFQNSTSYYKQFVGIFSLFEICETKASCAHSNTTKADLLSYQLDLYENYWDLTQGTTFDGFVSKNPCKRRQQLGLSNLYFTQKSSEKSPYPTSQGWFSLYSNTLLFAENIDLSNSHQFTVEFEYYPIDNYYQIQFNLYSSSVTNFMKVTTSNSDYYRPRADINFLSYSYYSYFYYVLYPRRWYKIYISAIMNEANNRMAFSVYYKPLLQSIAGDNPIYSYSSSAYTNSNMQTGSTVNLSVYNAKSIIKSVKFYKWAMSLQSLIDIKAYQYADNVMYNFQASSYNYYFKHYDYTNYLIDSSSNACNNFVPSQAQVCADLSFSNEINCRSGFTSIRYFCIDMCGDGRVQINPRVAQCDDGNFVDGDGCSSSCMVESGYSCILDSNLNNKSYCFKACGNGAIDTFYNEDCDDKNIRSGDGCSSNCRFEPGFKCDVQIPNVPSYCYPNCGDGKKDTSPYYEECDDGNNFDFDGCSKDCKKEFNYDCTYDYDKKADACKTIYDTPIILNSTYDSKANQITVNFDQTMLNQTVSLNDIDLEISGPNSPYAVSWNSNFVSNSFQINFTSAPILFGGIGEVVAFKIIEINKFKSYHKIPIKSAAQFTFKVMSLEPNQSTQAAGSGASYTFIITGLTAILIGVLTGGSIELMWSLANTLQIWVYFGMLDLYYSADLNAMYSYLKCANFDNPISDYINNKVITYLSFIINPVNEKFSNLGFESTEIISNSFDKLFMALFMLLSLASLSILRILVRDKINKFANFIKKKDIDFRYEGITRFFVEFILVISIANFINLVYGGFGDVFESVCYMLSVVILILTLLLIIYFYAYPIIYYESICEYPDKNERHCLLFLEFRRDNVRNLLFYGNFAVHRVAFAFVVACMKDFPINQCVCIALLSLWILCKTFCVYKNALSNFLNTFNGIILLFYSILLFMFISPNYPSRTIMIGYVCIGIIAVFFIINWLLVFPIIGLKFIHNLIDYFKQKCSKTPDNKITNKKPREFPLQEEPSQSMRSANKIFREELEISRKEKIFKIQAQQKKKKLLDVTSMFADVLEEEKKETEDYPYFARRLHDND